jgi:capsule polysaccharide export protein KpsE/RkpR
MSESMNAMRAGALKADPALRPQAVAEKMASTVETLRAELERMHAQLTACRAALESARPLVRALRMSSPRDAGAVLAQIEQALNMN